MCCSAVNIWTLCPRNTVTHIVVGPAPESETSEYSVGSAWDNDGADAIIEVNVRQDIHSNTEDDVERESD